MRNRRVEIDSADINTGLTQEIDVRHIVTETSYGGMTIDRVWTPLAFQIINDCGAGIEYNIIIDEFDYTEYEKDLIETGGDWYQFQRVPAGAVAQDDHTNFPKSYKLLIRGYESTASQNLIIEFINYTEL